MIKLTPIAPNVLEVEFDGIEKSWQQWMLLSADRHWDHPFSDRYLQRKHLEEAKERGAGVLDFGDLFCVMQSNDDKRASKEAIRPEHQKDDYLDEVVDSCARDFAPYPFWLLGKGNHDTNILKRKHTDLIARLADKMKVLRGKTDIGIDSATPPFVGGFSGWVIFRFRFGGTVKALRLWYHHGYGGDAPVTKGVIQTARQAAYLPDADIVCTGHTHNEWVFPIARLRISPRGTVFKDTQVHVKIPSYKDEYQAGQGGWEIERGAPPKTQGAMWLRFWYDSSEKAKQSLSNIKFEVTKAQ